MSGSKLYSFFIIFYLVIIASSVRIASAQPSQGHWERTFLADSIYWGSVVFSDSLNGYVGGTPDQNLIKPYQLYRSSDGGLHLKRIGFNGLDTAVQNWNGSATILSPSAGCVYISVGNPDELVASYDSGNTWVKRQGHPWQAGNHVMLTPAVGIRMQEYSLVQLTLDSGKTYGPWTSNLTFEMFYKPTGTRPAMVDSLHWTILSRLDTGLVVLMTSDAGKTWEMSRTHLNGYDNHCVVGDLFTVKGKSDMWLVPQNTWDLPFPVLQSSDYGRTWSVDSSLRDQNADGRFAPLNSSSYWLALPGADSIGRTLLNDRLYLTSDKGKHWSVDSTSLRGYNVRSIYFTDSTHGWLVADSLKENEQYPYKTFVFRYTLDHSGVSLATPHKEQLVTYPSPARDRLTIDGATFEGAGHSEIYDALGRRCLGEVEQSNGSSITINVHSLAAGYYTARIFTRGGFAFVPFVKSE